MNIEVALRKRIGTLAVDVNFTSGAGIVALFGRSGAGKSTIVNLIAGLLSPDSGRIRLGDRLLYDAAAGIDLPPHRRGIGYVFQEGRLFPHLTVRQNLLYGAWFSRLAPASAGFDRVVALLGIEGLLARHPGNLSGGEKQRVAIGRALLAKPEILLMDEPLAALDEARKSELLPYIERLRDEAGIPILYVSHTVNEVVRLAASVVLVSDGKSIAQGPVAEILGRLDLLPLTGQDEAGAIIDATVDSQDSGNRLTVLRSGIGQITIPEIDEAPGTPIRVQIKARDVMISLQQPRDISALNVFAMEIREIRAATSGMVDIRLGRDGVALNSRVTAKSVHLLGLAVGMPVYAVVKSVAFDRQRIGSWHLHEGAASRP